ncbi:hypothetical protein GH714_040025 [Hevea brasiliensis]|uniref:Voltage-dependent anion channel n=1 Tax=Hevea brasiliensis TaxID=3981 RepID=A0A6A6MP57_HEVBR|nr:hypothetical protein GH714_040025 [Hevea brasiliensis]
METQDLAKHEESIPTLIKYILSKEVTGFDSNCSSNSNQNQPSGSHPIASSAMGNGTIASENRSDKFQPINDQRTHSISISMPTSPRGNNSEINEKVLFEDNGETSLGNGISVSSAKSVAASSQRKQTKFHSQPMPKGCAVELGVNVTKSHNNKKLKDKRYDSFKTWSGKLESQISHLRGKPYEPSPENFVEHRTEKDALPVDRYYDALEGPELENLRASEEIVLPDDKIWPFLLRYPISSFGICLGISSQAIMWKTLANSASTKFLHISPNVNLVLWCISLALVAIVASIYLLKVILYFEAVRREYYHPIRANFFFAPWIALLFLALGVPPSVANNLHGVLWYILMTPILCLELKIYGQWMSGGQRRLSRVANPSNHLSVVGNFVGALLETSNKETLPKELHPVFFLFVAAPSVASMAWAKIQGSFDYGSRIAYFIALFLYFSLAVRINFFRGFKFSLAWWAYTFPMTGAAIATISHRHKREQTKTSSSSQEVVPSKTWKLRNKEIENYLKYANSDCKDMEACISPPSLQGSK